MIMFCAREYVTTVIIIAIKYDYIRLLEGFVMLVKKSILSPSISVL